MYCQMISLIPVGTELEEEYCVNLATVELVGTAGLQFVCDSCCPAKNSISYHIVRGKDILENTDG